MTAEQIVANLVYLNYREQRLSHPEISPRRWQLVFGDQACDFERRFISDLPLDSPAVGC